MKKIIIKFLVCILSACGVIGFLNVKNASAATIHDSVGGTFEVIGASLRNSKEAEDLFGIRFTTRLSKKAYKDILEVANGKTVKFGVEIVPADKPTATPASIQYVSTNPTSLENKPWFKTDKDDELIEYYATITYEIDELTNGIKDKLSGKLDENDADYQTKLDNYVKEYLKQAYGMQLKATCYYEISGERYYATKSITRSMSVLANSYANDDEYKDKLTDYFYEKEYFISGETKQGYINANGDVEVDSFNVENVKVVANDCEAVSFTNENYSLKVDNNLVPANIGDTITLYAFDKNNLVTTLVLEYVQEFSDNIKIAGKGISNYVIAVDENNSTTYSGALALKDAISQSVDKEIEIVGLETNENAIIIKQVAKSDTVSDGYNVYVENGNLIIECAYMNRFNIAFDRLISTILNFTTKVLEFDENYSETIDISKVYYSEFNVKGDGLTNDFYAMKEAHDFANISGQTVYGEAGKTYLITNTVNSVGEPQSITVLTNVDWMGARIVIDNRNLTNTNPYNTQYKSEITKSVFYIPNEYASLLITSNTDIKISDIIPSKTIDKDNITKVNNPFGYKAMFRIHNGNKRMFMRYGSNANNGDEQNEICLVDESGNLIDTNFLFDFEDITAIYVYRADQENLTVQNATIQTRASQYNINNGGAVVGDNRGIHIERPNTTLKGIFHEITDEIPWNEEVDGVPFKGFSAGYLSTLNTSNILVEDCVFQSRVNYDNGTYDISPKNTHSIIFKGCTQSNFFILDENGSADTFQAADTYTHWGVMGSNGCKNLTYDTCTLTRFDAHSGIVDGKIINSKVGQISVVGGGDLYIENTTIYAASNYVVELRKDYGSFWDGTITLKNSKVVNAKEKTDKGTIDYHAKTTKIIQSESVNHDFGFDTKFPNLVINNLKIENKGTEVNITSDKRLLSDPSVTVRGALDKTLTPNVNPCYPPEFITVSNQSIISHGYRIIVPTDNGFFSNITITGGSLRITRKNLGFGSDIIYSDNINFNPAWSTDDVD